MKRALQHRALLMTVLMLTVSCAAHAPATLSPAGVANWQANEAVVAIGTLQRAAIALNAVQKCEASGPCAPLLSDQNTRHVVDAVEVALKTIERVPDGWKAAANAAIDAINATLDAAGQGKLRGYLEAARQILNAI